MRCKDKNPTFGRNGTARICLMGVLAALSLSTSWNSFGSRWHGPICAGGSSDNELLKCVARYSRPRLSPADIRRFIEHGSLECFVRGYRASIRVGIHTAGWNRGFGLSSEILATLARIGLGVDFDLYLYGDETDGGV